MNIGEKLQIFDTYLESIDGITNRMRPKLSLMARKVLNEAIGISDKVATETNVADALDLKDLIEKLQWISDSSEYLDNAVNEARQTEIKSVEDTLSSISQGKQFTATDQNLMICNDKTFIEMIRNLIDGLVAKLKDIIATELCGKVTADSNTANTIRDVVNNAPVAINPNDKAKLERLLAPDFYGQRQKYSDVVRSICFSTIGDVCTKLKSAISEGMSKSKISTESVSSLLGSFITNVNTMKQRDDVGDLDIEPALAMVDMIPDMTDAIKNKQHQQKMLIAENDGYMVDKATLRQIQEEYNALEVEIANLSKIGQPRSVIQGSLESLAGAISRAKLSAGHTYEDSMMRNNINNAKIASTFKSESKKKEVFNEFLDSSEDRRTTWDSALGILRRMDNPSISTERRSNLENQYKAAIGKLVSDNETAFRLAADTYEKTRRDPNQIIRNSGEMDYQAALAKRRIIGTYLDEAMAGSPTGKLAAGTESASASFEKIADEIGKLISAASKNADDILDLYTAYFFHKKDPSKKVDSLLAVVKKKKGREGIAPDATSVQPDPKLFKLDTNTGKYKFMAGSVAVPLHVAYEMSMGWVEFGAANGSYVIQDNGLDKNKQNIHIWSATFVPNDEDWSFQCTVDIKGSQPVMFDNDFSSNDITSLIQTAFDVIGNNPVIN